MIPVLLTARAALFHGDSAQLGAILQPNTIDAIVTDPPAGIGFMGHGWDSDKGGRDTWIAWLEGVLAPAFAALKPGGHALVWAIPRTSHWTATALENMGFEIRDVVMHLFGTGFPKSMSVSKAIDDRLGVERPVIGRAKGAASSETESLGAFAPEYNATAPGSPEAKRWEGWGTALKPAAEHWILARKPLAGTVAANVLEFGTGALNVDGCRIGTEGGGTTCTNRDELGKCRGHDDAGQSQSGATFHGPDTAGGRWPAHVTLDEYAAGVIDGQSGVVRKPKPARKGRKGGCAGVTEYTGGNPDHVGTWPADPGGGPSTFFYIAKAPRSEKDAGLDHLPIKSGGEATGRKEGSAGVSNPRAGAGRTGGARNSHPTVKSVSLMRWLCKLVTPPGGVVLDPFAGSGTTGVAALAEGFDFIGCEMTDEYIPIIVGRLEHALKGES